jgi:hypothetical protein
MDIDASRNSSLFANNTFTYGRLQKGITGVGDILSSVGCFILVCLVITALNNGKGSVSRTTSSSSNFLAYPSKLPFFLLLRYTHFKFNVSDR